MMVGSIPEPYVVALEVTACVAVIASVGFAARAEIRSAYTPPNGSRALALTWLAAIALSSFAASPASLGPGLRFGLFLLGPFGAIIATMLWSEERNRARGIPIGHRVIPERLSPIRRACYGVVSAACAAVAYLASNPFEWRHAHWILVAGVPAIGYGVSAVRGRLPHWFRQHLNALPEPPAESFRTPQARRPLSSGRETADPHRRP